MIRLLERAFAALPLPLLEVWGRLGYLLGMLLMLLAFAGFTLRPGGRWGLGRARQRWDDAALLSSALTFVLIFVTGWIGSAIVLVPGAQTFESLKDLSVFLCVVLFGYPALLTVPFAYGLSDLIEGVPPEFLLDWLPGYFINAACFWMAAQLIGKNPDFRRARTWGGYLAFVALFMAIEPVLWGFICAGKFTPEISYRSITPALAFTTGITWLLAPPAMMVALPLARRLRLFWAEIPNHAHERRLGSPVWVWHSGTDAGGASAPDRGLPIHLALTVPLIALVLLVAGSTAWQTLRSAEAGAEQLAGQFQDESAAHIDLRLDDYFAHPGDPVERRRELDALLGGMAIAEHGRAWLVAPGGAVIASATPAAADAVLDSALAALVHAAGGVASGEFRFDVVSARPLARESWLARATPYRDRHGGHAATLVTALPASYYLAGVRTGNSLSAMVSAIALLAALLTAALLASLVTVPVRRLAEASEAMAGGELAQRVPRSRLEELNALSSAFNTMAQQIAQRDERLQLATRAGRMGIWDWDVVADHLVWDDAMYPIYDVARHDYGSPFEAWSSVIHPDDLERTNAAVAAALTGERELDVEFRIRRRDGSIGHIRGVAQVVRDADGAPVRVVGINYDITERKNAEAELLLHRDRLEQLVAERTAALSVAVAQAEAATVAKSEFLANMSHEIRTPMNAILGMTELALRTELTTKQADYLHKTRLAAETLLGLIDDVLDFSKIEAGKMELTSEDFMLAEVLERVTALVDHRAQQKNLDLTLDVAPGVPQRLTGDAQRLMQVLLNLSNNAVKFTERGRIDIGVGLIAAKAGRCCLRFTVRDTGIGMTDAQRRRLFLPFSQADASITRRYGGTGLGLAISKRLVGLMDGTIEASSEPGHGSEFAFEASFGLPAQPAAEIAMPSPLRRPAPHAPARLRGRRVLLVEDNALNQMVAVELLASAGVTVRVADAGPLALELLRREPFDAVLTDLQMPLMDGYAVVDAIRTELGLTDLPVIAMTAHALARDRERCLAAGMNDHLSKPFRPEQLFETLARWLPETPALPAAATPAPPTVDFAQGLVHGMGREPLYRQLLQVYLRKHGEDAQKLLEAQDRGDHATLLQIAHNTASTAGTLGAGALSALARRLQHALQAGDAAEAQLPALVGEFARLHALALHEMGAYLDAGATAT